jgi:predicted SAM-dependent methyltransferase
MIKQQLKDIYFGFIRFATWPNHLRNVVWHPKPEQAEGHYLHLGCGTTYIPDMTNIDGNLSQKKDLWLDLRNGLPFPTKSTYFVYCSHTLEHLYPDQAIHLLKEIRRILADEGIARIAVPSLEHALQIAAGSAEFTWPRAFDDKYAQAINYLFCDGQHKYGYSFGLLDQFARSAGFNHVYNYSADSGVAEKQYGKVTVGNEMEGSLVVELQR